MGMSNFFFVISKISSPSKCGTQRPIHLASRNEFIAFAIFFGCPLHLETLNYNLPFDRKDPNVWSFEQVCIIVHHLYLSTDIVVASGIKQIVSFDSEHLNPLVVH